MLGSSRTSGFRNKNFSSEFDPTPMVFEIDTSIGHSNMQDNTIAAPLLKPITAQFTEVLIDWGDGTVEIFFSEPSLPFVPPSHTYAQGGIYTVKIGPTKNCLRTRGTFPAPPFTFKGTWGINFGEIGDLRLRYTKLKSWGRNNQPRQLRFAGCSQLDVTATNTPDLSFINSLFVMFRGCTNLVGNRFFEYWDVSGITDMRLMFRDSAFNQDIGSWDVSSVTNMQEMFRGSAFDQDISAWDVSGVTNMQGMFFNGAFNQPIGGWNVSNVTNMSQMFSFGSGFNQDINTWDVSSVTNMQEMFRGNENFEQPIDTWNTSNVTNMSRMFQDATAFNNDLGGWCVQQIPSQPFGFDFNATNWLLSRPNWGTDCALLNETRTVTVTTSGGGTISPQGTFVVDYGRSKVFEFDIQPDQDNILVSIQGCNGTLTGNTFIANNITADCTITATFGIAFFVAENGVTIKANPLLPVGTSGELNGITFTLRNRTQIQTLISQNNFAALETTVTTGVADMRQLFAGKSTFNANISHWDTSNVTRMDQMFPGALSFNQDISNWDTSNVTRMDFMFEDAHSFNQPIGTWDTSNVTNMGYMFRNAHSFNQPIETWDTSNVTSFERMFSVSGFIGNPSNSSSFNQPIGSWNTANVTNMSSMFTNNDAFNQDILDWNTSSVTDMSNMFAGSVYMLWFRNSDGKNLGDWNVSSVTDMSGMFLLVPKPNSGENQIEFDKWNTSNVTNMSRLFEDAFYFDLEPELGRRSSFLGRKITGWNTANVTDMSNMFINQTNFRGVTEDGLSSIANWNTGNVINMQGMFLRTIRFNQDLSSWCVEQIPSQPADFDTGATQWTLPRPNFGAPC